MKKALHLIFVISIMVLISPPLLAQDIPADSMYLGQIPPGNTSKIFNLPIAGVHRPIERIAISSDGKEIYYGELNTYPPTSLRVKCYKYQNNTWTGPVTVFEGFMAPKFSIDDSVIYLQDNQTYTYYAKRTSSGWTVPVRLFTKNLHTHYYQITKSKNQYASSQIDANTKSADICKVIIINGDTLLQSLGAPVNNSNQENDFLIDPDESFLLFSRNIPNGGSDMHISFKRPDGNWTNPKKLDDRINKPGNTWEYGQFISKDGKFLFFTSGGVNWSTYYTYWVKIDNIIDSLRHTNFIPYINCQIQNQTAQTGKLFSYTIPDTTFIDDDGNSTLTYSASLSDGSTLPSWLLFDSLTKTLSGVPTQDTNIIIKITAKDNVNASASCMFGINITLTDVENQKEGLPKEINLYQNYPNPFNPTSTIEFAISKSGHYTLGIYNTLGELVKEIANREYEAGYHKATFNASGLSSGMYIYQLAGNDVNLIRKMVVLR